MWRQTLRRGLLALTALNPPAFLLAQNPARGIKFERRELDSRKVWFIVSRKTHSV